MRKIFHFANCEVKKTFLRPAMFILATLLVIALVCSALFFNPEKPNNVLDIKGESATILYDNFQNAMPEINEKLLKEKKYINDFLTGLDIQEILKTKLTKLQTDFSNLHNKTIEFAENNPTLRSTIISYFVSIQADTSDILSFIADNIPKKDIKFYITKTEYEKLYGVFESLLANIPFKSDLNNFTNDAIIKNANFLFSNYENKLDSIFEEVEGYEKIVVQQSEIDELLDQYCNSNIGSSNTDIKGQLLIKYNAMAEYKNKAITENIDNDTAVMEMSNLVLDYQAYVNQLSTLIKNKFLLMRIGTKKDSEINNYIGYEYVSVYSINEAVTKAKYFADNPNLDSMNFLNVFNFNELSGQETNAYDFTIFAMQILMVFITVFVVYFTASSISGEQSAGTLKMVAIRPYSRNKLLSGKILACFNLALILLLVGFGASFAVGIASYGFSMTPVLCVFNATTVFTLNPILLLLIYLASCLINLMFYISLTMLFSMIFKNTTISTLLSSVILFASIILNAITSTWLLKFLPTTHLDLFKYLGKGTMGLLKFSIIPDITFVLSIIIVFACIFVFNIISHLIFNKRNIA